MREFISRIVSSSVRILLNQQIGRVAKPCFDESKMNFSHAQTIEENELLYLLEAIINRDTTCFVWLTSSKIFDNLEELYRLHLPT